MFIMDESSVLALYGNRDFFKQAYEDGFIKFEFISSSRVVGGFVFKKENGDVRIHCALKQKTRKDYTALTDPTINTISSQKFEEFKAIYRIGETGFADLKELLDNWKV